MSEETGDRRQETGGNPPLAPPPPRRGRGKMWGEIIQKTLLQMIFGQN
ncbi:MAG: hypothetical protein F6K18_24505 [Okeania sp. SIO2C2]|nr:hypothetical protein [Okeania sp. SIO2C2]NEP89736.1 hypothetical protein [Okeania sp. SIO2C2]